MIQQLNTLVIGSGAAGLAAAVRLHAVGVDSVAIYTESLRHGTSINTGSDKQTYYKLGMYGKEPDSPWLMAQDLAAEGAVHGDIALVEAAVSAEAFHHLVLLGVPFPHDASGQFIGYKTDHDPKRRATSCGPYTSKEMCRALAKNIAENHISLQENRLCIQLLTNATKTRVIGALFVNTKTGEFEAVQAENVVFATGGPGNFYADSVYPALQTGGIGVALEAGAQAQNLAESQFGLASTAFRWNVSGSYMQVLPDFVSTDADGGDERLFLSDYFDSTEAMHNAIFLKGYQWPFNAAHVPGSSLIDIFTFIETTQRKRRVFLDFRHNRLPVNIKRLSDEVRLYLEKSGLTDADTPLKRLERLNAPAIALYREHGIDLATQMLEVAVCAQHNNGGLSGNIWWESVNLKHLFPIGEVNGSHGVARPGGSALNAGQVGAFRAAEFIAARYGGSTVPQEEFEAALRSAMTALESDAVRPPRVDWRQERRDMQQRMSAVASFVRSSAPLEEAILQAKAQCNRMKDSGFQNLSPFDKAEFLRTRSMVTAQLFYLMSIHEHIHTTGSRGGAIVLGDGGTLIHPKLPSIWKMLPEKPEQRHQIMTIVADKDGTPSIAWEPCRPVPQEDGWFETVWREFREGSLFCN